MMTKCDFSQYEFMATSFMPHDLSIKLRTQNDFTCQFHKSRARPRVRIKRDHELAIQPKIVLRLLVITRSCCCGAVLAAVVPHWTPNHPA